MPTEPLQIHDSVVVQSQAIADHPQLMYLGGNPMATVTSVNLAAGWSMVRFQNLSHHWILNGLLQKSLLPVPKPKLQFPSFSLNLDLPKRRERPGKVQEGPRHHEEEDSRNG